MLPNFKLAKLEKRSERVSQATLSDGSVHWDYQQLCHHVQQWVAYFERQNAQVVAFELDNGLTWAAISLALLESQRVAVPIPNFFSVQQKRHAIESSGAHLFIGPPNGSLLPKVVPLQEAPWPDLGLYQLTPTKVSLPAGTAIVTYTSGSTGAPKGVCLSRDQLLESAQAVVSVAGPLQIKRHLCALPLSLLLENVAGLYANLLNGSQILIPALAELGLKGSSELDLERFIGGLQQYQPQSLILVPGQLLALVTALEWGAQIPDTLKFAAVGGGKVATSLLERAAALDIPIFEGYGLTECGSVLAMNAPDRCQAGSVGALLPHVKAQCVDGELMVTHPRMLGYVGDHTEIGAEDRAHIPIATGDLVEFDSQGFLYVQGRSKHTFITAYGRNLSPEWIESELQGEVAIAHAVVFGEGAQQPVALILPRAGFQLEDAEEAISRVNSTLPDYARVKCWQTISACSLADCSGLTPNGRLRRQAIADHFQVEVQQLLTLAHPFVQPLQEMQHV